MNNIAFSFQIHSLELAVVLAVESQVVGMQQVLGLVVSKAEELLEAGKTLNHITRFIC